MGSKKNIVGRRKGAFNKPGGRHSKRRKIIQGRKIKKTKLKYKHVKSVPYKMKSKGGLKTKFIKLKVKKALRCIKDQHSNKIYVTEKTTNIDGNRILNMEKLKSGIIQMTKHAASCQKAIDMASGDDSVVSLEGVKQSGFYTVLKFKCLGCAKVFEIENSENFKDSEKIKDINVRCVWGSMVTGGGCSSLNESMGTAGIPGIDEREYTKLEHEIGKLWKEVLEDEMIQAGLEEKRLAEEEDDFFQGVPAISVICDGGWSKRSHKHSYNAMAGVGVIFGARTSKLLHIGIRNKLCYICSRAQTKNVVPPDHECFKNWDHSSQSMETDIILEGFLECEKKYGVRYMRMISDGDSSVYANVIKNVPVWGGHVEKIECANHATKCLRSNLEKLINLKPEYKGKGKLTKTNIRRITSGVRCAIIMRSKETDRKAATKKLKLDIKNTARHVLGHHDLCSTDFCKQADSSTSLNDNDTGENEDEENDVIINLCDYWKDCTKFLTKEEENDLRKGGAPQSSDNSHEKILKDVFILLNRLADKAHRLIGNFTSNLAESWMNVRCKFDGGKMYNKCFKGSFYARCYGGALRSMFGPAWAPQVYQKISNKRPDNIFIHTYRKRMKKCEQSKKSHKKTENIQKRKKRKLQTSSECSSKRAKLDYGENILIDTEDVSTEELNEQCQAYLQEQIENSNSVDIETETKGQSENTLWYEERKKRLTSSNFGEIVNRSVNNNSPKLVQRLLYSKFKGTVYTIKGLSEEENARTEYLNVKKERGEHMDHIDVPGLKIDSQYPFLAASSDGIVMCEDKCIGLIEIKTLLQNKKTMIKDAAKNDRSFCLKNDNGSVSLKDNHKYYFQIQGQLNILGFDWCDLVIRRINPYDLHIQRIYRDQNLWDNVMVPKLRAFYLTHLLPELAVPRFRTITGIRKPSLPWFESKTSVRVKGRATKKSALVDLQEAKITTKVPEPQPSTSSSTPVQHSSTRDRRVKFVGRMVSHQWTEADGSAKWYQGTVLSVTGKDGDPKAVYQVLYEGEDDAYDVEGLPCDYKEGTMKFIDL